MKSYMNSVFLRKNLKINILFTDQIAMDCGFWILFFFLMGSVLADFSSQGIWKYVY